MPELTCIVAEDESLLREALLALLAEVWPELCILAACDDGASALDAIAQHQPQLAFLDIRMPGLTGLEVAQALEQVSPKTQVVFVTAYDQYAIAAFDQGAVDYLQKPVARERLLATRARILARERSAQANSRMLADLIRQLGNLPSPPRQEPLVWLTASSGQETRLILVEEVAYFQSDAKYTVVMTAQGEALLRKPIRELLAVLDPNLFKQIHRSTIVNLKAIAGVVRDDSGKGTIRLKSRPETLSVSQPFMTLFRNM